MWEDSTLRTLLSLYMPHLRLDGQTMKLQANAGAHLALSPARFAGRHWTCTCPTSFWRAHTMKMQANAVHAFQASRFLCLAQRPACEQDGDVAAAQP